MKRHCKRGDAGPSQFGRLAACGGTAFIRIHGADNGDSDDFDVAAAARSKNEAFFDS
jgi:hypothetical protein